MRKPLAILCAVGALLTISVGAQQPPIYAPLGGIPVLETYLESLRQQAGIPGMSAAIVHDGTIIWERGYGFENTASRIRATPDTAYLVGNLSDTLAAVLVLQCVEQRKIELNQPVAKYGVEGEAAAATAYQLLSHTFRIGIKINGKGIALVGRLCPLFWQHQWRCCETPTGRLVWKRLCLALAW